MVLYIVAAQDEWLRLKCIMHCKDSTAYPFRTMLH